MEVGGRFGGGFSGGLGGRVWVKVLGDFGDVQGLVSDVTGEVVGTSEEANNEERIR